MTKQYLLAIDQGTSSSRTVIYDARASVVASAQQEFRQIYPKPGWVEHDPEEIWASVTNTLQESDSHFLFCHFSSAEHYCHFQFAALFNKLFRFC